MESLTLQMGEFRQHRRRRAGEGMAGLGLRARSMVSCADPEMRKVRSQQRPPPSQEGKNRAPGLKASEQDLRLPDSYQNFRKVICREHRRMNPYVIL